MKRKFFSFALIFCLIIPCMFMLSACGDHEHTFETTWTSNETHHWHAATCENCDEKADYAEHIDEDSNDICDVCLHGQVATINTTGYADLESAIEHAQPEQTIYLYDNIELTAGITINKTVTINLNNKTITAPNSASTSLFRVENGGLLTIDGEGTINSASQANDYSMAVWARNGGRIIINGGTFTNVGGDDWDDVLECGNNNELIYASNTLTDGETYSIIEINGGTFIGNHENETWGTRYTLNMKDNTQCDIKVNGGSYYRFNPSASLSEFPQANFVVDGFKVEQNGDYYTVVEA